MADFSIIQKIKLFFDTIVSTSFFMISAIIGLLLLVLMIYSIKKKKKISKIVYIVSLSFLGVFVFVKYFNIIVKFFDTFIEMIINLLYFPSLGLYVTILLVSNLFFVFLFFFKKTYKSYKLVCGICNSLIDFLFIMVIGIISTNNIDISIDLKLYSDSTILTLLQLSMAIFISMWLIIFFIKLYHRFRIYDKNVTFDDELYPEMPTYIKDRNLSGKFSETEIKVIKKIEFNSSGDKQNV